MDLRQTFGPGATKLGLVPKDSDDLDAELTRTALAFAAAWHGRDSDLVKQALDLAAKWRELPGGMRGTVLEIAVDASPELGTQVQSEVVHEQDRRKRDEMLGALAAVRDPKRYETALALLLDKAVDFRESMWMLFGATTDPTRLVAQNFFRAHEAELVARMPKDEVAGTAAEMTYIFTSIAIRRAAPRRSTS